MIRYSTSQALRPSTGNLTDTIADALGGIMTHRKTVDAMADAMVVAVRKPVVQAEINRILVRGGAVIFVAVLGAMAIGRVTGR